MSRRNRLKEFYGLQTPTIEPSGANELDPLQPTGKEEILSIVSVNPIDINSRHFQASEFVQRALKDQSLCSLLRTQCEMTTEIKTLDADMKSLVYENYEKFISANDTIKKMKFNVENMEVELSKLSDQIGKISSKSTAIHDTLNPRRSKMRQLGGRHSLLKKLQFVFELPSKLGECLGAKRYFEAACWLYKTANVFAHYRDLAVFDSLEKQTIKVTDTLSARCVGAMAEDRASVTEVQQATQCLMVIQRISIEILWKDYIKATMRILKQSLSTLKANKSRNSAFGDANLYFLTQLIQSVEYFRVLFLSRDSSSKPAGSVYYIDRHFSTKLSDEDFKNAQEELDQFLRGITEEYFSSIQRLISSPLEEHNRLGSTKIQLAFLEQARKQINDMTQQYPALKDILLLRMNRMIIDHFAKNIQWEFSTLRSGVLDQIKSTNVGLENVGHQNGEMKNPLDLANDVLMQKLLPDCLRNLLEIKDSNSELFKRFESHFKSAVRLELRHFWSDLIQELMKISNEAGPEFTITQAISRQQNTITILMLSLLCQKFYAASIVESYSTFACEADLWPEMIPKITEHNDESPAKGKISAKSVENLIPESREIRDLCRKVAQKMTMSFIEKSANQLCKVINMCDLMGSWSVICDSMRSLDTCVGKLVSYEPSKSSNYETHSRNSSGGNRSSVHSDSGASYSQNPSAQFPRMSSFASTSSFAGSFISSIQHQHTGTKRRLFTNIGKLMFSDKSEIYSGAAPDSRSEIIFSVLKIILKAFVEIIRDSCTIDSAGMQQFDAVVQYIRSNFHSFVADDKLFEVLMEDIVQSTYSRCIDEI